MKSIIFGLCVCIVTAGCTRINSSAYADAGGATTSYEYRTASPATDDLVNTSSRLVIYGVVMAAILALAGNLSNAN